MAHHARPMLTTKCVYVLDDAPDFFVRQLLAESNHAGTDRSVLDYPEDFAFRAMTPESVVLEIARRWIQLGGQRPIAAPVFPVTVEASALAVISGEPGNGLVSARASASLSAGTTCCIICRSAAPTGTAKKIAATISGNILVFITLLL
jgi:hypothetical protein